MAEFQWWLLLVGLVAGGGLVAVVTMDGRRREEDLAALERRAEAAWIAERVTTADVDGRAVESILRLHREYLGLPPPDALIVEGVEMGPDGLPLGAGDDPLDRDPDRVADDVGDGGGGSADQDLARAGEEQASTGEEAHTGADREQGRDR